MELFKKGNPASRCHKGKEKARQQAIKVRDTKQAQGSGVDTLELPFQNTNDLKLLGRTLENAWSFKSHMGDMQRK